MNVLPPELRLLVVGYISRPSDLKNLCLVSKKWQDIAAPRLYAHVTVNLLDRRKAHSLLKGKEFQPSKYLKATKALTLFAETCPVPDESWGVRQQLDVEIGSALWVMHGRYAILERLTEFCGCQLEIFRDLVSNFDSTLEDDVVSFEFLLERQTNLRHVAFTGNRNMLERVAATFPALTTVEFCDTDELFSSLYPNTPSFLANCAKLERLCLVSHGSGGSPTIQDIILSLARDGGNGNSKSTLHHVKTLNLVCPSAPWGGNQQLAPSLLSGFAFDSITSLSISSCPPPNFYTLLGTAYTRVGLRLRHFSVHMTTGLLSVLKLCHDLRSLHLSGESWDEETGFLEELHRLGRNLSSLSYHNFRYEDLRQGSHEDSSWSPLKEPLATILERCPRLSQFSYHTFRGLAPDDLAQALPLNLSILHLTPAPHFTDYQSAEHADRTWSRNQAYATTIFKSGSETKPKLRYLVLGYYGGALPGDQSWESEDKSTFQQQLCYVKGKSPPSGCASEGIETVVAVPIARSQLFDMDAEAAEILNLNMSALQFTSGPIRFGQFQA